MGESMENRGRICLEVIDYTYLFLVRVELVSDFLQLVEQMICMIMIQFKHKLILSWS